ncbi:phasin superfamily protein [Geomonas sp. RF6]|uniref:phasin family protein n=1 Tax=Geomonas sp. RF6 TaxID=2897342 RepID=UPI001E5095E7|nr:phasin superfamily protein [Geomonas sp. RF6]UFS68694.1 phasin superfamily protein [Geomonas sp. RF6]
MFDLLEKAVLTALGVASITQKRGEEMLQELRDRYKMSEDEGRAFIDRLQDIARQGKERSVELAESEVRRALDALGIVSRDEFERLRRRVEALEAMQPIEEIVELGPEC